MKTLKMTQKLAILFNELNKIHIVAKRSFACCQTCGWAEIIDFADANTIGFAFYHRQDTPSIRKHGQVYIAFGAHNSKDSNKDIQIGNTICFIAKKIGLKVKWGGTELTRILLLDK